MRELDAIIIFFQLLHLVRIFQRIKKQRVDDILFISTVKQVVDPVVLTQR
jgi:hypothetical protein